MTDGFTPSADELIANNRRHAERFDGADRPGKPSRRLAVVACMDCRLDVAELLGLGPGEAHIIRNAGGVITDDVIRSLCLSQRLLDTREILLIHHTQCGLQGLDEDEFTAELERELGVRPSWPVESFSDARADVAQSMMRLEASPFVQHCDHIRGFVYDVGTGLLDEVVRT